jgi:hypothetical protein
MRAGVVGAIVAAGAHGGAGARTRIARLRGVLLAVRWGVVRYVAIYDRTAYATPRRLAAALRLLR